MADWLLLATVALIWGSSFVFIAEGLEAFPPSLIAFIRLVFGVATLACFPGSRRPTAREDWIGIALLGFFWMGLPFVLFPIAQQWIDSSLAGMINGAVPIFAAAIAALFFGSSSNLKQIIGFLIGFGGVVAVSAPALGIAQSTALGVFLVLVASVSYGVGINIAAPLQQRYGALPVLLRAQGVALGLTLIPAVVSLPDASFQWRSLLATIPLGVLSTGFAFVAFSKLIGRVGPARGSIPIYFVPIVAVAFGTMLRDETVTLIQLVGTAMVILGAVLGSRQSAGVRV